VVGRGLGYGAGTGNGPDRPYRTAAGRPGVVSTRCGCSRHLARHGGLRDKCDVDGDDADKMVTLTTCQYRVTPQPSE